MNDIPEWALKRMNESDNLPDWIKDTQPDWIEDVDGTVIKVHFSEGEFEETFVFAKIEGKDSIIASDTWESLDDIR